MPTPTKFPKLDELPLNAGDPPNSAWGLWGEQDKLGSLNHLTDELVLKAVQSEIKTGERVGLDLPLDHFDPPLLGRVGLTQEVINKDPFVINDDVITFNTQCSSQWDSLRHFAYQKDKKFYNGTTQQDIHRGPKTDLNSLQPWTEKGLAGRGVLVDYETWASKQGKPRRDYFAGTAIPIADVKTIVAEQNVELRRGDVLFLRTGYVRAYGVLSPNEKADVAGKREWTGLAQGRETTVWLWENQFAAVASDSPGFECRPPTEAQWHLHPILLAGWGTPIGELFDLEKLASLCQKHQRWSFFFTSAPLNYTGAVASPPNAIAIF
ncbi:cyclase family protein [Microdochium nivale]|nr:cyclase family protein [Microdochium nivale]